MSSSRSFSGVARALLVLAMLAGCSVNAQPAKEGEKAGAEPGSGRPAPDGGESPAEESEEVAPDSPRASMAEFLALTRAGDYEGAARYLELPANRKHEGAALARRLKAVLDRRAWVELESLSPLPTGNPDDDLPAFTDQLGRIDGPEGMPEPIRIVRKRRDGGVRWLFSMSTVSRIDGWYRKLEDRWMLEHLPSPLLKTGPRELMWWQWLALPLLVMVAWLVAMAFATITAKILGKVAARSAASWDDLLLERLRRPVTLAWMLALIYFLLPWLALYEPALEFVHTILRVLFLLSIFWGLVRSIDIGGQMIVRSSWGVTHDASRSLVSLGSRVGKVAVVAIGAVAMLSQLGYPVASIIAGLGVGGLAVALAAQKTVENLFGAFSIGADQPFREGDFVRVENFVGTVERIGLRSTKFRTLERTLVTIPNGKLADMKLETFAARDRLRLYMIFGLDMRTTSTQLREVIAGIEKHLNEHPRVFENSTSVRFEKFGPSSLDIEVATYFTTKDWAEFTALRQQVLLEIMGIIERAGTSVALPTSTIHVAPPRAGEAPPSERSEVS